MRIGITIIKKSVDKDNIVIEGDSYGIIFYGSLISRLIKQSDIIIGNIVDVPTTINQYSIADINCMLTISKLKLDKSETLSLIADLTNNIIYQEPEVKVPEQQINCGSTCLEYDRMFKIDGGDTLLKVGDQIIFNRVGAYTMALTPLFIHYFPLSNSSIFLYKSLINSW